MNKTKIQLLTALLIGAVLIFALTRCTSVPQEGGDSVSSGLTFGGVSRVVDTKNGVVCYVYDNYHGGGISCIPMLEPESPYD